MLLQKLQEWKQLKINNLHPLKSIKFPLELKLMEIFIAYLLVLSGCTIPPTKMSAEVLHNLLSKKATEAKRFCIENKLDTTFCILIDMRIPSGKFRLFLWDFKSDSILDQGLCSHGSCGNITLPKGKELPYFTNQPDSYCSSLGKYRIGKRGWSTYGIHVNYKLHGLEETNSNAYDRDIVLHAFNELEDEEIHPKLAKESWGCPAVSNALMTRMDERLAIAAQPVLLWIYNN